jgi:hypothetical protein
MTFGYPTAAVTDPNRRPGTVTAACILTGVFASLAIAAAAVMLLVVTAGRDQFVDEWEEEPDLDGLDVVPETAANVIGVVMAVCILLAVFAIVVAIAAFRRSSAGRVTLMVLSGLTAVVCLVLSVAIVPFLWVIASTVTLILLFTTSANRWYARPPQA